MSSYQIQIYLWVPQPVLQAALATVICRRKLYKQFPAFFIFTVAQLVVFAVEFPVYMLTHGANTDIYFNVYWCGAAVNVILAFKIIHEIFLDVFRPYPALRDLGTALFKWAAVIMVLTSMVLISLNTGWDDPLGRTVLVVQRCVRVVQCGMVIFLLAFCKNLRVSWRRLSFGIALGFGIFSAPELLMNALFSGSHVHGLTVNLIELAAYILGMGVWLVYSLLKQPQMVHIPVLVPQRWDEALMEIQPQAETESLIPMFETMVDRALSRAQDSRVV
jgi:hypothetical protein